MPAVKIQVRRTDALGMAALPGTALLAGGNPIAIRFSSRELAPMWGGTLRFALSAALLATLMTWLRVELPRGRALVGAVPYGAFNSGASFALAY